MMNTRHLFYDLAESVFLKLSIKIVFELTKFVVVSFMSTVTRGAVSCERTK